MTRVKICGLTHESDVAWAIEQGAHAVGFVSEPTSPRSIGRDPSLLRWTRLTYPETLVVSVFGPAPGDLNEDWPAQALQSVDLRAATTWRGSRWQVIRLKTFEDVADLPEDGDFLVIDAFSPQAFGGTGKIVDWSLAAEVVHRSTRPVVLAGGLTPDNVVEAVTKVQPFAVDVSSGVELTPGRKDPVKVRDFVAAVKSADRLRS